MDLKENSIHNWKWEWSRLVDHILSKFKSENKNKTLMTARNKMLYMNKNL